jgi:hypothetical protein
MKRLPPGLQRRGPTLTWCIARGEHVVAQAEIRRRVSSVAAVVTDIDTARDAIWDQPPAEVLAIGRGEIPRGTGSKNNYLSTLIFAENELRTLTDEVLWFAWVTAIRHQDADLGTLKLYMDSMCQYKANMLDYVGLPNSCEILKQYVGGIGTATTWAEFAQLTESAMTYFNRLHGWVDLVFPWGIVGGFTRTSPLQKIVDRAAGSVQTPQAHHPGPKDQIATSPNAGKPPMRMLFTLDDEDLAVIEIWEDKIPQLAQKIRDALPFSTYLQHGKLTGDLLLMQTKILADWENIFYPEDLTAQRQAENTEIRGAVSYYGPRQQISIMYGNDVPPEPLPVSAIGQVVEGKDKLELIGLRTWLEPGARVWLSLIDS